MRSTITLYLLLIHRTFWFHSILGIFTILYTLDLIVNTSILYSGAVSLTVYCRSLLSAGKFRFLCPYVGPNNNNYCGTEWNYVDVRRLAVLTQDEKREFEKKLSENYLRKASGVQECPKCNSLCERQSKNDRCVRCPVCTIEEKKAFDFCWFCLHEWKGLLSKSKCGLYNILQRYVAACLFLPCPWKWILINILQRILFWIRFWA